MTALQRIRFRLVVQRWIELLSTGLLIASGVGCAWLTLTRCFPALGNPMPVCLVLLAMSVLAASIVTIRHRPDLVRTAIEADLRCGLKERLSSSLELAGAHGPMIEALHADARDHLKALEPARQFPLAVPTVMRWALAPVALFGLIYAFMPECDVLRFREKQAEESARKLATSVRVQRLESVATSLQSLKLPEAGPLAGTTSGIQRIADEFRTGKINEKQAFARLTALGNDLKTMSEGLASQVRVPLRRGSRGQPTSGPSSPGDPVKAGLASAREKLKDAQEKLKKGSLSAADVDSLEKETAELTKALGGTNTALGGALSKELAGLRSGMKAMNAETLTQAMESVNLTLNDLSSVLDQLEKMRSAANELWEVQQALLGQSGTCRTCGVPLKPCAQGMNCTGCGPGNACLGVCALCGQAAGYGEGMRGSGRGQGGQVGPLPDTPVAFQPSMLPGPVTRGKALATIMQRTSPDQGAQPSAAHVSDAFVAVRQETEEALTKEEIPPGSREFVRQYFGSIEPKEK